MPEISLDHLDRQITKVLVAIDMVRVDIEQLRDDDARVRSDIKEAGKRWASPPPALAAQPPAEPKRSAKREVLQPVPEDPLVPIEYLLGLVGWKSRSTYYNHLRENEPGLPKPVRTGTRNTMLLKSECDAYRDALVAKSRAE